MDALIGTGSAAVTVRAGTSNYARVHMKAVSAYGISLSQTGTCAFPAAVAGYGAQTAKTVTVSNTGNQATGALTIGLSGADSASFALSAASINSMGVSGNDTFTVVPNIGLAIGTYTATVTVSGDNGISASFTVSFRVNPGYTGGGVTFKTVRVPVPGGGLSFPTGTDDSGTATVDAAYEIGETEVTYELWYTVRSWAESNGYTFNGNPGREGSSAASENTTPGANSQEPVTMVDWFDAAV